MEKINIRMADKNDASEILDIYSYYVINTPFTFEYTVPSILEFEKRIENVLEKYPYIVAEKNGKIVGYTYASPFKARSAYDWSVETSIYVGNDFKRLGIGRLLYESLERILKKQNVINLVACITYPNSKSISFHEHFGYVESARVKNIGYKFGKWHDVVWLQKSISEHFAEPKKIIPISEMDVSEIFQNIK